MIILTPMFYFDLDFEVEYAKTERNAMILHFFCSTIFSLPLRNVMSYIFDGTLIDDYFVYTLSRLF